MPEVLRRAGLANLALAGSVALALWSAVAVAGEGRSIGEVRALVGTATVTRDAGSLQLAAGSDVQEGDRVATGAASRVEIGFGDGSTLVIGESSRVSLPHFEPSPAGGSALLELLEGILRIDILSDGAWRSFEVRTYTAVASARSTQWVVEAKTGTTGVFVVDGTVEVTDRLGRGAVLLEEGFGTDVAFGTSPAPPKRWGAARAASAVARTSMP
jgi:ferric-dicitrate binding protein FerR (iron transport regulator)